MRGIEDAANLRGYGVVFCNTDDNPDRELECYNFLRSKMVDGIISVSYTHLTYLSLHDVNGEMSLAMSDMRVLQKLSVEFLKGKHKLLRGASVIVMDAGLPQEVLDYVAATYGGDIPVFADPVSTTYARKLTGNLHGYHTLKPNRLETEIIAGRSIRSPEELRGACRALIGGGLSRVVVSPVSYTHLDVYKRQAQGWGWGLPQSDSPAPAR